MSTSKICDSLSVDDTVIKCTSLALFAASDCRNSGLGRSPNFGSVSRVVRGVTGSVPQLRGREIALYAITPSSRRICDAISSESGVPCETHATAAALRPPFAASADTNARSAPFSTLSTNTLRCRLFERKLDLVAFFGPKYRLAKR